MLFGSELRNKTAAHRRMYAAFEIAYTCVDFGAALCFIIGSVMFFFEDWQDTGTWFFLWGSIFFALKPTLRLIRELKLAAIGDTEDLADRLDS